MTSKLKIAIDAMGGDHGPDVAIPGAALAAKRHPDVDFIFYGDSAKISPIVAAQSHLSQRAEIRNADVAVGMDEKPSQALRRGRNKSGMWLAIESVRAGEAAAVVSAGNTGALMAMARFILRTMPGIERPAIAAVWPTMNGECVVLDVGATVGADAHQLVEFAIMGEAMASCLFGKQHPTVGLLNIGVEEVKGNDSVKEAGRMLRELKLPLKYEGYVEGDDIGKGKVDVVVTEGFTGNVALKTAEGTSKQITSLLRSALRASIITKIGAFLASSAFDALRDRLDPRKHNGGVLLGLNGVVVKSHGGTDALGFATAIEVAIDMVRNGLTQRIAADVAEVHNVLQAGLPSADTAA
ncbi:phosphate acyltransferase PlsX [Aestuariivirga litoralis]|uniref:phosphate acyltransferase PlsX n=1 Tax=Aestuariivirga litoralis TaxID=2650924 RepID=UPI0018C59077|nr:phosphate acyltransferase PlsX [Aestuariivirga litoralis]MBG1231791.1 phosphate acyltransferase PlsX [Aestuariivirga litoralis]